MLIHPSSVHLGIPSMIPFSKYFESDIISSSSPFSTLLIAVSMAMSLPLWFVCAFLGIFIAFVLELSALQYVPAPALALLVLLSL